MEPPLISGGNRALRLVVGLALPASMEPPLISGGNYLQSRRAFQLFVGFNGAAADQRRKYYIAEEGHAQSIKASMEPPLISGGNPRFTFGTAWRVTLQWSRR